MISARARGLRRSLCLATTPGTPSWAPALEGRDVTIVMDADRAGRLAARRIEQDLIGVARTVAIADLAPSRGDGYDLTDWLDAHRTLPESTLRSLLLPSRRPASTPPIRASSAAMA